MTWVFQSFTKGGWITDTGWWFGTWILWLSILGIVIPTDFHIFQRGRYTTNQNKTDAVSPFLQSSPRYIRTRWSRRILGYIHHIALYEFVPHQKNIFWLYWIILKHIKSYINATISNTYLRVIPLSSKVCPYRVVPPSYGCWLIISFNHSYIMLYLYIYIFTKTTYWSYKPTHLAMVPQYLWFITPVTMIYGTHSIHRGFVTQPTIQELGRATLFFFWG